MIRSDEKRLLLVIALAFTLLIFLCVGCGKLEHTGGVKATVTIDEKIEKYFRASCTQEITLAAPPGTPAELLEAPIEECTNAAMGQFLEGVIQ